jgi:hypothetical protein
MASGPNISLAVGDGSRRMTYAELAEARGISLASARRLARRHQWPRQVGNDGVVRVIVPLGQVRTGPRPTAEKAAETSGFAGLGQAYAGPPRTDPGPAYATEGTRPTPAADGPGTGPGPNDPLAQAIETLREQLARERMHADRAEAAVDHLRGRIDQLMTLLADRRPWWRRWFR